MTSTTISPARRVFNKVPEITVFFWIIKVLCTTVGETASDFLNATPADGGQLGLGIPKTFAIMGSLLLVFLFLQFRSGRYNPPVYWVTVVLISIVGTLVTDWLHDDQGVSLVTTTIIFTALLGATFAIWFAAERTLSIHAITTPRREGFYWMVVLFTFALGTSAGDLLAERLSLGYFPTLLIFIGMIALVAIARFGFKVNAVLTFWIAYILTRPLGGSTGDLLSQSASDGVGLGTTLTSAIFLSAILAVVVYLTATRVDATENHELASP